MPADTGDSTRHPAVPDELPRHRLSAENLRALAHGDGGPGTLDQLRAAERSRRLLLLRALDDALAAHDSPTPFETAPAWELLARAQRQAPADVDDLLMYPQTGMWLAVALRGLRGAAGRGQPPLWVVLGHLSALAAAAGVRAGLDFAITVPVRRGYAPLPMLGCAVLETSGEDWTTARVRAAGGRVWVETPRETVALPDRGATDGPGWHALRRIGAGPADRRLSLALEDMDPYRTYARPSEPAPLSAAAASRWQEVLTRAWTVLERDEPRTADAMRHGLMSLTPVAAGERFRPHSVSAGDAFGGVMVSEPDDPVQLAATLVHEFQHIKLSGLLHLAPLCDAGEAPDGEEELFYAPWRDDPRPLGGLLQGIFAFMGVTRFWRAHRHTAGPDTAPAAHFEFALWRTQLWSTLLLVHRHRRLTPLGLRFLEGLRKRCAAWLDDPVPPEPLALAEAAAADHRARWRAHHLRPAAHAVEEAVHGWLRGSDRPPRALAAEPLLVPDARARWLDSAAALTRHRLSGPPRAVSDAAHVSGALPGDTLLAVGEHTAARAAYVAQLVAEPGHAAAWAGLGRALTAAGSHPEAADLLRHHPERACAVHPALLHATGRAPDPLRLADWLARTG